MKFIQLPEQFSTVQGELPCTFAEASDPEVFLLVINTRNGTMFGSKRFYRMTAGTTNIAPMLRRNIHFSPSTGTTGLCDSQSRVASVRLSAQNTLSDPRTFVAAVRNAAPPEILTTMPRQRIIPYGASDEITCCIPAKHTLSVTTDLSIEPIEFVAPAGRELTVFRLDTRMFHPSVSAISVRVVSEMQTVGQIDYVVTPALKGGCRLAWRSGMGSIEHYTFPVVKSVVRRTGKEQIYTAEGGYADTGICSEESVTLLSAFESAAMIAALGEIAVSPQVWLVDGADEYRKVDVLPTEQTLRRHGSLCCVEVSLRPKLKTRLL